MEEVKKQSCIYFGTTQGCVDDCQLCAIRDYEIWKECCDKVKDKS